MRERHRYDTDETVEQSAAAPTLYKEEPSAAHLPHCLDIRGAARYLDVSPFFVRTLIVNSRIGYLKAGHKYIVPVAELKAFVERERKEAS